MNILELLKKLYNKYLLNFDEETENVFYIAGSQTLPPPLSQK